MNNQLFTLIIPVYNVAPYIRKCLDSILNQRFERWEAVLVDDGSSDESGKICDEYAARDGRFKVFHKANGGVSTARNMGLDHASGEWIWYVDPDDWIADDALEILSKAVDAYPCDTVFFGIEYYDENNRLTGCENRDGMTDKSKDQTIDLGDYPPQNYLLKRQLVEQFHLRFSEGIPVGEDLEHQCKYLMVCRRPISLDKRLYKCLQHYGSASRNPKAMANLAKWSPFILEHLVDFISEHNIPESAWLAARLNRTVKSVMSSNYYVTTYRTGVQQRLRKANGKLRGMGYREYSDTAVKVGVANLRLYYLILTLRKLCKR